MLFVINVNDLFMNLEEQIRKLADDMKLGDVNKKGCPRQQQDIDQLENWVKDWQMHVGMSNRDRVYAVTAEH